MKPKSEAHAIAARWMNRLLFVRWDRYIEAEDTFCVYGWIDREDGRADFVLFEWTDAAPMPGGPISRTSSAKHSKEIGELLFGDLDWYDPEQHIDCQRIEDDFGGLVENVVRAGS